MSSKSGTENVQSHNNNIMGEHQGIVVMMAS